MHYRHICQHNMLTFSILWLRKSELAHKSQSKMEHRRRCSSGFLFTNLSYLLPLLLPLLLLCFSGSARAYENYTVGDSLGWFDNLAKPDVNYQKWVADKNFSLGDFLIFNTDNNHTVIQTYNFTTYKLCDYNDAQDTDTIEWSASDPSATEVQLVTMAVPLVKEGMTYFFSSDYDGEQCQNGQHFEINVTYGQGLPKSLRNPSDESPSPASSPVSGDDDVAPGSLIPSNFTKAPSDKDNDDGRATSGSVSMLMNSKLANKFCVGLLFCLALICWF